MPRSSRHKSSKHSREYSDSERDSSLKEKKAAASKDEIVSNNSGSLRVSSEKRKLDSKENKENKDSVNGEYVEEYSSSSSKRRKERVDESNDRWNGGSGEEERGERKGRDKGSEDKSKSRRRDDSVEKRSEGKHRESSSSRKEGRERDGGERERERERKGKEGRNEKGNEVGEYSRSGKGVSEKTDLSSNDLLRSPETENRPDRRSRRKRDDSVDVDKHQEDTGDINGRRLTSRENVSKDGRSKDEKYKDDRCRDKYRDDMDIDNRHRDEKQRDERVGRQNHINSRSDEKHSRDEKDSSEIRKKSKPQDSERERERHCEHEHDREFDIGGDREQEHDRDRDRDRDCDRDHDHDWDWDRSRDRDRDRDRERDRDRDQDRDHDYDGVHIDDRSGRYKDSRGRKRSPADRDDYADAKSRGAKASYPDMEKKSLSGGRVESDTDRGRSQSRQAHLDNNASSNRWRTSQDTGSHGAVEEYRHFKTEESKYRDVVTEQRPKTSSSREAAGFPATSERASKYRSTDKPIKADDSHAADLSIERSSSSKASPRGLVDRSPSSSLERRYANRTAARRSLDIEESGRRSSGPLNVRDFPSAEDRISRDFPLERPLLDEPIQADSPFYNKTNQNNMIPPTAFRGGGGSPFMGSLEEDNRVISGARYKRAGDPNLGRGQGNAWRGTPNWSSPMPNGFIPFQHGPGHGGFQAMMPHFPSPPLFSARPSIEINHSGIPYHIPDADRFPSHLRPLGWHNMMDGSGPSHMHGWDGNNGVFRDETHSYGGPEWDQNRHQFHGRGWEASADTWKAQNGDLNMDSALNSVKEDFPLQAPVDDVLAGQACHQTQNENSHHKVQVETVETKLAVSLAKESSKTLLKITHDKTPDPHKMSSVDDSSHFACAYLSKLDISTELAGPDLYTQCLSLLSMEPNANADENAVMLVNLRDGARAVPKSSSSISKFSLFPAAKDSVFQRAMDFYKKQRAGWNGLTIVNSGIIDVIATSEADDAPINDPHRAEEPVLNHDEEMPDVPVSLDQKKLDVPIAATQESLEDIISTPRQEERSPACTPYQELPDRAPTPSQGGQEKAAQISSRNEIDGVSSELVNAEGTQGNCISSPGNNASQAAAISPTGRHILDEIGEIKANSPLQCAEERPGFGDSMCGPLIFSDDSPKASGDLMPGSSESESVILSRIHHSPESTH